MRVLGPSLASPPPNNLLITRKSAEAEESCGFFEYSFVFTFICMGFKEQILQKLRKAVGFLNILLYSLVFAWVLWKLLDANIYIYIAAIRMGFERILEMLSLYSWVLSKFLQGR